MLDGLCRILIIPLLFYCKIDTSNIINKAFQILFIEFILFLAFFYNIFIWKEKPKKNKFQIIDKIYDCCDEYTQYHLDKLKKNLFDFSYFWTFKLYLILLIIFIILLIILLYISFSFIYIQNNIYFDYKNTDKENKPLIPNEKEPKELEELTNNNQV